MKYISELHLQPVGSWFTDITFSSGPTLKNAQTHTQSGVQHGTPAQKLTHTHTHLQWGQDCQVDPKGLHLPGKKAH